MRIDEDRKIVFKWIFEKSKKAQKTPGGQICASRLISLIFLKN